MIVSLNEIETTILKAARGAGMEWGLAEEAAHAAAFLTRLCLPFEEPCLRLFSSRAWNANPVVEGACIRPDRLEARLCPIRTGAYLSDLGSADAMTLMHVVSPLLLLPFIATAKQNSDLAWKGVKLRFEPPNVALASIGPCALLASEAEKASLSPIAGDAFEGHLLVVHDGGVRVDDASWAKLHGYEALTYVPASAKSRVSGAGAGAIDND